MTHKRFRALAAERLVDVQEVMSMCGVVSRQGVYGRVGRGTLPQPVWTRARSTALWDRHAVQEVLTGADIDRKEGR